MATRTKFQFTNRNIAALPAHEANSSAKAAEYSDLAVVGLKVIVGTNGIKRFAFRYQTLSGRKRYATLGTVGALDVAEARKLALEMRAIVERGGDPLEDRDRIKTMPTFSEFVRQEYLPYAYQTKRSAINDDSKFRLHLEPKFGHLRLCDITTRDVQMHHASIRESHSPGTANRHLALLSATFRKAMEWDKLNRNPAAGIKAFKENNQRQRFLSPDEIGRLFAAMEQEKNKVAVAALKLLLLTGTRRQEALGAQWKDINLDQGQWWLPHTKNGTGRYVTLSDEVKAILVALPSRATGGFVFPSRIEGKAFHNPRKAFDRLLKAAGIEHMRIHDLRHSFASLAVNSGATLYEVQDLLGHSTSQMTQRYAHLADAGRVRVVGKVAEMVRTATIKGATTNVPSQLTSCGVA